MDFIKDTWAKQAKTFQTSHAASWKDIYAIDLEINTIGNFIKKGDTVLDVGCANGYSTFKQLKHEPAKIVGVDFVEEMITYANQTKDESYAKENITFAVGDVRDLKFPNNTFDVTYTTRVLINLSTWEEQIKGLQECIRVTKKGGTIVISEAFWEPLMKLNALRVLADLPPLVEHDFNRYLKKEKLIDFLNRNELKFQNIEFSSLYYLGSRFVRECIDDLEDNLDYKNKVNTLFYELEKTYSSSKGFGIQQAFVIHR